MLQTREWIALITGVLGLAATAIAVIRYLIKKEQMEGDMKRLEQRYSELDGQHKELLQEVGAIKATGTAVLLIKSGIDGELELAMKALQASASSILFCCLQGSRRIWCSSRCMALPPPSCAAR